MLKFGKLIGAVVVVGLLGLLVVSSVFAQEPAPVTPQRYGGYGPALGRGMGVGSGLMAEAVADVLGMTPEEICEARAEGQTLADLAAQQGASTDELVDAIVAAKQEAINQALADGRLTQEQADWMLERAEDMAELQIENASGPGGMRGAQGGMGGRGRGGAQGAQSGIRGGMRGGRGAGCALAN